MTGSSRRLLGLDLLAFVGTAAAALMLHWETRELVWGLWLSSLVIGYATIVLSIARQYWFTRELAVKGELTGVARVVARGLTIFLGLFALAFFTVHFGGFHYGHGMFLNLFFPVSADPDPSGYLRSFPRIVAIGWPMVVGSAISSRDDLLHARDDTSLTRPYLNVVRMHLLIFVFAGAAAAHLDQKWLYLTVLFCYFFPFGEVKRALTGR
jgi:hypothetical protein